MLFWKASEATAGEFETVALVHLDTLYRTALRFTHNRAEAEDLVQETWARALRSFHRFDPGTNCRAWLLTILRNAFLNRLRRKGREELVGEPREGQGGSVDLGDRLPASDNPEEEFFQTVLHGDIDRAIKALPPAFRDVVVLADLEGLTYREIADVLGCPIGTVMSRLARARAMLRRTLGGLAREHGYSRGSP